MFGLFKKDKEVSFIAPMEGEVVDIVEVPDQVFSRKMVGDGIAIKPTTGVVVAPCNGKIVSLLPSNHAVGIIDDDGIEILIHVGIDTVELKGKGLKSFVNVGDVVKKGDLLIEADLKFIESAGKSTITPIIITNMGNVKEIVKIQGNVEVGKGEVMKILIKA
ncbi:PTS sugar transporter subunit IIA [Alkaliphilus peptidifermentans]|uniref:PTS system IIA component, Glc family (TC 4.A.1) n=1 Tax=Alkaliphilus peptidifermentans DSM 18978 TaxID=1120976 RepID=A0A1G5BK72_9FIRM|nr:PTS glucose transporter subunit IIA [Alkaliphilus peptidifermentans]SCX90507.1 PTS system IIA component, Glc family (TC 4.A.1) [Alkaliphilus peptidifermentans DSM 18978]